MQPRSALLLLLLLLQVLLLLLPRRAPVLLAGADPARSHADIPYCGVQKKETCGVCTPSYRLWQPCGVEGRASGSVVLPCAFHQSWGSTREAQVSWHLGYFKSKSIVFNTTDVGSVPLLATFSGRVSLAGDPLTGNASLLIRDLRLSDANLYFCRVGVLTAELGWKEWQGINGTRLTVAATGPEGPTAAPPSSLVGPAVGATAAVLLALALLGVGVFLARRRGSCRRPPPGRSGLTVEKEEPRGGAEYEEVGAKGSKAPPPSTPEDPHLFYAALTLSEAGREGKARPPPPETTYAAIRT